MPYSLDYVLKRMSLLARHLHGCDPAYIAVILLMELGVSTKYDGFEYLKCAIVMRFENPRLCIAKEVYPAVSRQTAEYVSENQVERSIRNAIRAAFKYRDEEAWAHYFPTSCNGKVARPSNAEFITRLARVLELWKGCCQAYEQQSYSEEAMV